MVKRALVVEDNEVNRTVISALLAAFDLSVSTANNGVEALDSVHADRFDIILMDLQMPVMNGIDATRQIRSLGDWCAHVPIIAVTANADMLTGGTSGADAGFTAVVSKPIDSKLLAKTVLDLLPSD